MLSRLKQYLYRGLHYIIKGPEIIEHRPNLNVTITYTKPSEKLIGKKIVVTGGTKGIGYAMAKKFVEEGAEVLIVGRNGDQLQKVSVELSCKYLVANLQDPATLKQIIQESDNILGGLNCLVNNAGISLHEDTIRNVSIEQFDSQINTNLRSGYFLSQQFIRLIEATKRENCNILFVSSERGTYVDDLPYGLTKNAMNCLVQGLASRFIKEGIRVNAIAPGITATDLTGFDSKNNLYIHNGASNRVYLPEEMAEVACFLLSDISKCVNGQILTCDEGRSINAYWR